MLCFAGLCGAEPAPLPRIALTPVVGGLAEPVFITHAGDRSGRLFIVLQRGRILVYDGDKLLPSPFLDIRSSVGCCGERGLLSLAFHPDYSARGHVFVNYTDADGDTVVARYTVAEDDPDALNPGSRKVLLHIAQPYANHNGGQIAFGPQDGLLYIGTGDGGSAGDPQNNAQNLQSLLGKMLRIDVDGDGAYAIPPDNPFAGDPNVANEIWALGLRNPWRFSFDRLSGDLFVADVGQGSREEVNVQTAGSGGGQNYGWRLMEGTACFEPSQDCERDGLTLPALEYSHAFGCSISGGYRYRGTRWRALQGVYFYGDYCSGRIWGAREDADGVWIARELLDTDLAISTFGEDEAGEIYLADHASGTVFRILPAAAGGGVPWAPLLLDR